MLQKIRMDEESSSDAGSYMSSEGSTAPSSELGNLDLSTDPSMSTVYGSEDGNGSDSRLNNRPTSPSRTSSAIGSIFHRRRSSRSSSEHKKKERENHMCKWLQAGNVIYKSVGLGLMDLTVGLKVIEFAKQKGFGTHVEGF